MRHFSFNKLTFTNLEPVKIEVIGGSRPRLTLEHSRNRQRYFLKSYRHNTREVWAEMLASQLGELIGLDVQAVSLKKIPPILARTFRENFGSYLPEDWQPVGALVRNVFPKNHELLYGAQIIGTASDPVTLEKIENNVRERYLDSEDILQSFADMVVFDAWIGNMDRHHENWAILQRNVVVQFALFSLTREQRDAIKRNRRFSPLFDHGSSLLFELSDADVRRYLENPRLFTDSYVLGKRYSMLLDTAGNSENIYEIIKQHIEQKTPWARRFRIAIGKVVEAKSLSIARLILQMPTDGELTYSKERKDLLYLSLEERKEILKKFTQ